MKRSIIFIILFLAMCGFTVAQSSPLVPDKVKEIQLLESTRDDVQKILAGYDLDISNEYTFYQRYSSKNETIEIWYSQGGCSSDQGDRNGSDDWNVAKWKVIQISISPDDTIKLQDINFNSSGFIKEREYSEFPHYYIYHNKNLGIAYEVDINEIRTFHLKPGKRNYFLLCNNQDLRKFYAGKSWFNDGLTWKKRFYDTPNFYANVTKLSLSSSKIIIKCSPIIPASKETGKCAETVDTIDVSTAAEDRDMDVLTYNYSVTGGKIIGKGSKIIWDLSGEKPGNYTITAGVDDGCGVCGKTITKTVTIKECPSRHIK